LAFDLMSNRDRRYDGVMSRLRRCEECAVSSRAHSHGAACAQGRPDFPTLARTVGAIPAISYRFLARAAPLKRQMPFSTE
jgi:hypothetical protein